jgi:hypothetical protein
MPLRQRKTIQALPRAVNRRFKNQGMNELSELSKHMRAFGMAMLGRAVIDSTFAEIERPFAHPLAVNICAHAAEILLKARIAQEHPLLIFSKLPNMEEQPGSSVDLEDLIYRGRSLGYAELPGMLIAATGYRLNRLDLYRDFGKLRNTIVHFAAPKLDYSERTLRFAFEVLQPAIKDFWGESIFDAVEEYGEEYEYVVEQLEENKIPFEYPANYRPLE